MTCCDAFPPIHVSSRKIIHEKCSLLNSPAAPEGIPTTCTQVLQREDVVKMSLLERFFDRKLELQLDGAKTKGGALGALQITVGSV